MPPTLTEQFIIGTMPVTMPVAGAVIMFIATKALDMYRTIREAIRHR